ncbi:MAG: OsmC family protein [Longimicrobiaceae bacterium]
MTRREETTMGVEITGSYIGDLKMELRHGPSGVQLRTAAPRDNLGDGSSFSPTDLLAAALGSCMVSTMAIVARRSGIPFEGASFSLEKHMTQAPPRRVDAVPVTIRLSASLTPEQRETLEHAARTCPVERSLSPEVRRELTFVYE